jgi:hypothetical protein
MIMKKTIALSALALLVGVSAFAQDPGMRDSLIVGSAEAVADTPVSQIVLVHTYVVTDDSVMYYSIPLHWDAPLGGVTPMDSIEYFFPYCWEDRYDTIMYSQNYIRMLGWAELGGDTCMLNTDSVRVLFNAIPFIIAPNTPSQQVVLDSAWDDRNGSVKFGLIGGITVFTPRFQRGFISFRPSYPTCPYIPGDINGNGQTNGIDVTYGVIYLKGGTPPPVECYACRQPAPFYAAGDVNGSCQFNGIDITYFITYLIGGPALLFCSDCPPSSRQGPQE